MCIVSTGRIQDTKQAKDLMGVGGVGLEMPEGSE